MAQWIDEDGVAERSLRKHELLVPQLQFAEMTKAPHICIVLRRIKRKKRKKIYQVINS